jgi:hypothetical protein
MRDIDQIVAALKRRHPDLLVEQRPGAYASIDEEIWFINLPSASLEIQLESETGNCPFMVESSLSPERLNAATIGETINMVSTMLANPGT